MNIEESLEKLYSLQKFGIKLGLNKIADFLSQLRNPQNDFKSFHVAGSNGKGSTTSFIASILMEAGYKVGLYTSPHFVRFNERVKIGDTEISDKYISDFITQHFDYIIEKKLTFFEATTALAFKYFSDNKVEYAAVETGLGGRLDATNVIDPLASVITSISLEHTDVLGESIEKIAFEKAGIIKPGKNVFIGKLPEDAVKVLEEKCKQAETELFHLNVSLKENNDIVELITPYKHLIRMEPPLKGKFQKYNSALAAHCILNSFPGIKTEIILRGIKNVVENTGIQGRYEVYCKEPMIIFDSSHNPEGVENFIETFGKESVKYKNKIIMFGAMRDKDIPSMLISLKKYFNEFRFIEINMERCARIDELAKMGTELGLNFKIEREPIKYLKSFIENNSKDCLVVLGSIYVLGTIKSQITLNNA